MMDGYRRALDVATEAAREAGGLLREEFLRSGGPVGSGGHAPVDERAEQLIRGRLLAATPEWSYRGEETRYKEGSEGQHVWLVDPNDGTSAYLQGWRGTATSIGLLRDGVPVLGVVYSYAAPDNEGDLFAWAEGCGPLRRNGEPVERHAWASTLSPETVSIISQAADRATSENLACVAPCRYLAQPSIAYRLGLVAAGEGEVAAALSGPGDWDYAGGHALLLGCGGALVDEDGGPVSYTRGGQSSTSHCFGGASGLLSEMVRRPWNRAITAGRSFRPERYDLAWPVRGQTVSDSSLLRRAQGCWLGQLCGDALGSMVEFRSGANLRERYPHGLREIGPSSVFGSPTLAGQPTDDSEMALLLARAILQTGAFEEESVAQTYCWWTQTGPFDRGMAVGRAVDAMCEAERRGESVAAAGRAGADVRSQANGAMMRQSPLAIWGHSLPAETLDRIVRTDTTLTHPNQVCQDASAAFVVALAATIRDGLDGKGAYEQARAWDRIHGRSASVTEALEKARQSRPDFGTKQGWVLIALQNAFYRALHAESFEAGVVDTVMGGGDTDTNAAIAGALLGAIHGAKAVPSQWRQTVLTCRPQTGVSGVQKARPRGLWPVDALILAERLVVAGRGAEA